MITLTYDKVKDELLRIGRRNPNHRGDGEAHGITGGSCKYVYPDGTRCIIGELLVNLGMPENELDPDEQAAEEYLPNLEDEGEIEFDARRTDTIELCMHVQQRQDKGMVWGEVPTAIEEWERAQEQR